jgi:integrase
VRYLRQLKVAPNGHPHTSKRHLRDKGVKYVLQVCRSLFTFAQKRRHLPPYAENPFALIEVHRLPIEDAKPVVRMTAEQERLFFEACDDWQLPLFATLALTGLRPGELVHVLWPDDLDLEEGWLHVRNKPRLGWQVKTRNERRVPLVRELIEVFRIAASGRASGPLFCRRRFDRGDAPRLAGRNALELQMELQLMAVCNAGDHDGKQTSAMRQRFARRLWIDMGVIKEERLRVEFMRVTRKMGLPDLTAPKLLRHMFATTLQEGRVDPLIATS